MTIEELLRTEGISIAPRITVFSDEDHCETVGLDYPNVSDPIQNDKGGTLTLHGMDEAFESILPITSYELVVDGQIYKAGKLDAAGDLSFTLPKMSSGDKVGMVYAVDKAGNRSEGVEVYFDVDDKTAPVLGGELAVTQTGNDFNLSWASATDDSPYEYTLVVKDGKNVVYTDENISGNKNSYTVNLADMDEISGKNLSFELFAHQEITEKGVEKTIQSATLKSSVALKDMEAPVAQITAFSDMDHYEAVGLDYANVSDPIQNDKGGTLTLHGMAEAFTDNVKVTSYELVVEGQTYNASKLGDYGQLSFALSKMSSGDKVGMVYAVDKAGNRSEGVEVYFDVDDKTAPVLGGELAVTQTGNDFNLSWASATDDSPYEYTLVVKDGKNVVYTDENISGNKNSYTVNLADMDEISGKNLSFELFAHQEITEKGVEKTIQSATLKSSVALKDMEAPVAQITAFSDMDHYEAVGLDYANVSDPIQNDKGGTLTLHGMAEAFTDNVKVTSYELVVEGQTYKASKLDNAGDLSFTLPKMSSGDKVGTVYALDAAGNRSNGVSVYFDVDDKIAPVLGGKLAVSQNGNDFNLSWASAMDDSPYEYTLVVKDGKNVIYTDENISGDMNAYALALPDDGYIGKNLSFELFAHQEISEKGEVKTIQSATLKSSVKVRDMIAPVVVWEDAVFVDNDYAEANGLDFINVSDPIHNGKGTLGLYGIDQVFADNVGIKSYELTVDNKVFKTDAAKMADYWLLNFNLSGLSLGDKTGSLCAVDAAGNRSAGIDVHFDVDDKKY